MAAVTRVNRGHTCFNFLFTVISNTISKVFDCCFCLMFKAKIHKQSISHENLAKSHIHNQQTIQERLRQQKKVFLLCLDLLINNINVTYFVDKHAKNLV